MFHILYNTYLVDILLHLYDYSYYYYYHYYSKILLLLLSNNYYYTILLLTHYYYYYHYTVPAIDDCLGSFCDKQYHPSICSPKTIKQVGFIDVTLYILWVLLTSPYIYYGFYWHCLLYTMGLFTSHYIFYGFYWHCLIYTMGYSYYLYVMDIKFYSRHSARVLNI